MKKRGEEGVEEGASLEERQKERWGVREKKREAGEKIGLQSLTSISLTK